MSEQARRLSGRARGRPDRSSAVRPIPHTAARLGRRGAGSRAGVARTSGGRAPTAHNEGTPDRPLGRGDRSSAPQASVSDEGTALADGSRRLLEAPRMGERIGRVVQKAAPNAQASAGHIQYTLLNDGSDQCTTGAQRALPLRLGPQIQTLLSRERCRTGLRGTGRCRGRKCCPIVRGGDGGSHAHTQAPDATAVEDDHVSWLRRALADATQGGRQLAETPADRVTLPA